MAGRLVAPLNLEAALASPDVARARADLPLAGHCRFRLSGPVPVAPRDVLLQTTPIANGKHAYSFYGVLDARLPMPAEAEAQAVGGGEFQGVAFEMLGYCIERGGMGPEDRVLDVGCGVGRVAYALAYYLKGSGRYDGFDVMQPLVEWATEHLGTRLPHFRFRHLDLYNGVYNPFGRLKADRVTFPYADASFDFVFLTSVFTHMPGTEVRRYLDEIHRVLVPAGRVLITAFVLTPPAKNSIRSGTAAQALQHPYGDGYVADPARPEGAIGFDEASFVGWVTNRGFRVAAVYPGSWSGPPGATYQDLVILERE